MRGWHVAWMSGIFLAGASVARMADAGELPPFPPGTAQWESEFWLAAKLDNCSEMLRHLERGIHTADPAAFYQRATLLHMGRCQERDLAGAAENYGRAGERGHGMALILLGIMHFRGEGVPRDFDQGRTLIADGVSRLTGPSHKERLGRVATALDVRGYPFYGEIASELQRRALADGK